MTQGFENSPSSDGGAAEQAKEKAQEKAQQAAGKAKNRLTTEVDTRSTQAGEQLRSTAGDVRSVAGELRGQGKDKPADLAEKAAERVERLGDYLHRSDGDRLLSDAEDFARSRPWAVAVGGLLVGFAASRFLKASSDRRYQARRTDNGATRWPAQTTRPVGATAPRVPSQPDTPYVPSQPDPSRVPPPPGVVH
jgi:ElaB/YqjD/DUF883 family membrane-anchored ribosome-binding protein